MRKLLPAMITVSALLAGCASNGTAPGQATSQVLHRKTLHFQRQKPNARQLCDNP